MPMKPKALPSLTLLREMFEYDPQTGVLTNKISRTARKAGTTAGHRMTHGHLQVYAGGRLLFAHRVAWFLHYGAEPSAYIDHINGNPADNRIANLRECLHTQNMMNCGLRPQNTSGAAGVHRRNDNGKWRAYITAERKRINLGQFDNFEEACAARTKASEQLHGEFARSA